MVSGNDGPGALILMQSVPNSNKEHENGLRLKAQDIYATGLVLKSVGSSATTVSFSSLDSNTGQNSVEVRSTTKELTFWRRNYFF